MKPCGSCTLCCDLVPVKELDKPGYQRCFYQGDAPAAKIGCAIYDKRPMSCQLWTCQYAAHDWDDDLRPDRCGVVFDPIPDLVEINGEERPCVQAWVKPSVDPRTFGEQPLLAVVLAATSAGRVVLFRMEGQKRAVAAVKIGGHLVFKESELGAADRKRGWDDETRLSRAMKLDRDL